MKRTVLACLLFVFFTPVFSQTHVGPVQTVKTTAPTGTCRTDQVWAYRDGSNIEHWCCVGYVSGGSVGAWTACDPAGAATTFFGLTDTDFTSLQDGECAVYRTASGKWENETCPGGGGGLPLTGGTLTGDLTFDDGAGDSPAAHWVPQTGTAWSIYARDSDDDFIFSSASTAVSERIKIFNPGTGKVSLELEGALYIGGVPTPTYGFHFYGSATPTVGFESGANQLTFYYVTDVSGTANIIQYLYRNAGSTTARMDVGLTGAVDSSEFDFWTKATGQGMAKALNLGDDQNSQFFGDVTANKFWGDLEGDLIGNVTGNVTGNVSGSAGSAAIASAVVVGGIDDVNMFDPLIRSFSVGDVGRLMMSTDIGTPAGSPACVERQTAGDYKFTNGETCLTPTQADEIAAALPITGGNMTGSITLDENEGIVFDALGGDPTTASFKLTHDATGSQWHPQGMLDEQFGFCFNCGILGVRNDSDKHYANNKFESGWNKNMVVGDECSTGEDCELQYEWNVNFGNASGHGDASGGWRRPMALRVSIDMNGLVTGGTSGTIMVDNTRSGASAFDVHMVATCTDSLDEIINWTDGSRCTVTACDTTSVTCSGLTGGLDNTFTATDEYIVTTWPRSSWSWSAYDSALDPAGNGVHLGIQNDGVVRIGKQLLLNASSDDNVAATQLSPFSAFNINYTVDGDWDTSNVYGIFGYFKAPSGSDDDINILQGMRMKVDLGDATASLRNIGQATAGYFGIDYGSGDATLGTSYGLYVGQEGAGSSLGGITSSHGIYIQAAPAGLVTSNHFGILISDQKGVGSTANSALYIANQTSGNANKGNIRFAGGNYNTGHLRMGTAHSWGNAGYIYVNDGGLPTSGTDGLDVFRHDHSGGNGGALLTDTTVCHRVTDLGAITNYEFWMAGTDVTITSVGCHCIGTCTPTIAEISLEDRSSTTSMTTGSTVTCSSGTGNTTMEAITAGGSLVAGEGLMFDVDNTPNPTTDEYSICVTYQK